jgi:hypothetical protein
MVDDADPVAHVLGDLEDVGGEEDRRAPPGHLPQDVFDQPGRPRVEADRRLVQQEHPGIVNQGCRQGGLLAHAMAVGVDRIVAGPGQVEHAQQFLAAPRHLRSLEAVQVADKLEQLTPGELGVQVGLVGNEAGRRFGLDRLGLYVVSRHVHASAGRLEQPDDHPDGGRLPGAVRPQEAEDLAGVDTKVDVIHGQLVAVTFHQVLRFKERAG